ncbi:cupin domain-containing protein [Alloscardovia criceti]|uniref:cupin domain-containing protein n=1 Tax=Alloscardovia criceti TaxID=356828 RepID=UPI000379CC6A|nr:cupin domain-containing protein [Alloscardovia criceti]
MTEKNYENEVKNSDFGFGALNEAYAQYFTGNSYLKGLVAPEDNIDWGMSQVSFEPGCINHWHAHTTGYQVLLCTAGEGWVQEAGKEAVHMKPGDVYVVRKGVKHWHGAGKHSWFAHIAITSGQTEWYEPVDEAAYEALED